MVYRASLDSIERKFSSPIKALFHELGTLADSVFSHHRTRLTKYAKTRPSEFAILASKKKKKKKKVSLREMKTFIRTKKGHTT